MELEKVSLKWKEVLQLAVHSIHSSWLTIICLVTFNHLFSSIQSSIGGEKNDLLPALYTYDHHSIPMVKIWILATSIYLRWLQYPEVTEICLIVWEQNAHYFYLVNEHLSKK